MKALIVNGNSVFDNVGGSEIQMRTIGECLAKKGHSVVYYFRELSESSSPKESLGSTTIYSNNKVCHPLIQPLHDAKYLAEIIRRESPDVLFTRCFRSLYVVSRAGSAEGVPIVYQVPFQIDMSFFTARWLLNGLRKSLSQFIFGYFSRRSLSDVDCLLTVSQDDAQALQHYAGLQATALYNMHPIPYSIEEKIEPPIVAWINNIKTIKRPEMFIELASRCADLNARFVMSGSIPSGRYGDRIGRLMASTENLEYIGPTSMREVNHLLESASVNVLTSSSEGFSNGLIQGWFREVPALSTIDKDQIIRDRKIGIFASDVDTLEKRLRYMLEDMKELRAMAVRAREYAIENHSVDTQVKEYEAVFDKVITVFRSRIPQT